jgi:NAD-dependent deacetylase
MLQAALFDFTLLVRKARRAFVFTGAGVSTGSNIPDFRGPRGIYKEKSPVYHQEFVSSRAAREAYWAFKLEAYQLFQRAKPNAAHQAIAAFEKAGHVAKVVTQNIDGLHQAAGTSSERLIELHGTNARVHCDSCGESEHPERCMSEFEATGMAPLCAECGGLMRPSVVMFGETLDLTALREARLASVGADLIMSLGSSLVVTPAADLPLYGARSGTPYVVVNRGSTPHDEIATLCIDDDVQDVLTAVVDSL